MLNKHIFHTIVDTFLEKKKTQSYSEVVLEELESSVFCVLFDHLRVIVLKPASTVENLKKKLAHAYNATPNQLNNNVFGWDLRYSFKSSPSDSNIFPGIRNATFRVSYS